MTDVILTINAGSSSLKFALHPVASPLKPVLRGKITGLKRAPVFKLSVPSQSDLPLPTVPVSATHELATDLLLDWLDAHAQAHNITAAGHRVVHGGRDFTAPVVISEQVLELLEALTPLAPLHQPHNLSAIRQIAARRPELPQIACFDTSFHTTQDPLAKLFALPKSLGDQGLIRYGFHGLSYDYITGALPDILPDASRIIVAHLGNGASLCAMRDGQSVATTMGFTALDGLVMGRRCGALDPGVILHLVQQRGMSVPEIEKLLYQKSGLLGVSGISNSMQDLEASDEPDAALAIDLFCYRAAAEIAQLIPALGGLDALVFTAGIGENSAMTRAKICARLEWLGVTLDQVANADNAERISTDESALPVVIIPTNEDAVIAKSALALM
ncbi:MAG: acetate/propionate family kinase [Pseudomonadota bacterium]